MIKKSSGSNSKEESKTNTSGSCLTSGGYIRLDGDQHAAGEAVRKLDQFVNAFEQLLIELPAEFRGNISNIKSERSVEQELLHSVLQHYIRPLPWLCAAYVERGSV